MPYKPKRGCGISGCPNNINIGESYCAMHKKQNRRQYDKSRPSAAVRGYDAKWRKYREWYLRENPLCAECRKENRATLATVVDHIQPVNQGGSFWDTCNHQPLCKPHHDSKTATESGGFGK